LGGLIFVAAGDGKGAWNRGDVRPPSVPIAAATTCIPKVIGDPLERVIARPGESLAGRMRLFAIVGHCNDGAAARRISEGILTFNNYCINPTGSLTIAIRQQVQI
jgi:hypothetical protein